MLDIMLTVHWGNCSVDGSLNLTSINILAHPRYKFEGDLCLTPDHFASIFCAGHAL
jgi:hypothetical protein